MNTESVGVRKGSVRVFRNVKALAIAGMLLALHVVLAVFVSLPLTDTVKISVSFITNVATGYLFGPWMALICGALGDILQFMIKPTGAYFFGWTFNAAMAGLIYGMAFYRRAPRNMEQQKEVSGKADLLPAAILLLTVLCWFAAPFLNVLSKVTAEQPEQQLLAEGTAFQYLTGAAGEAGSSAVSIAAAALVLAAAGIIFSLCHKRVLTVIISAAACLWLLLPVYTDRKVMEARAGFYLIAAGFFLCIILELILVLRQNALDGAFLLRCFLTMALMAVVVQMFLGTVWCSVMYGKGFWFYFVPRAIKSTIQLPFNTVLVYYCLRAMKQLHLDRAAGFGN